MLRIHPESATPPILYRRPVLLVALLLVACTTGFRNAWPDGSGMHVSESAGTFAVDGDTLDIIVDVTGTGRVEATAYWKQLAREEVKGAYGSFVLSDEGLNADSDIRFIPTFPTEGTFEVALYWPSLRDPNQKLASNLRVSVRHAQGQTRFVINQQETPETWRSLGHFPFEPGKPGHVQLITDEANGVVLADAVRFRLIGVPQE